VHGRSVGEGDRHDVCERRFDVVRGKDRVFGGFAQAIAPVAHHVGERAHIHAHLAVEGGETAKWGLAVHAVVDGLHEGAIRPQERDGCEGGEPL
jgi:hypothetical protein